MNPIARANLTTEPAAQFAGSLNRRCLQCAIEIRSVIASVTQQIAGPERQHDPGLRVARMHRQEASELGI